MTPTIYAGHTYPTPRAAANAAGKTPCTARRRRLEKALEHRGAAVLGDVLLVRADTRAVVVRNVLLKQQWLVDGGDCYQWGRRPDAVALTIDEASDLLRDLVDEDNVLPPGYRFLAARDEEATS